MRAPHLPHVSAGARRRRRVLVAALVATVVTGVLLPRALDRASAATTVGRSRPDAPSPVALVETGCTLALAAGTTPLHLTLATAQTLTDIAGADQNAARTVAQTASSIAVAWPSERAEATSIATSLRGYRGGTLACTATLPAATKQGMQADGLTPRANQMWTAIQKVFGWLPAGGFAPGGVHTGHVPGSAHYEGRAIDFFYRPITAKTIRHGWVLSQWLVAHAEPLQIATVIFDAKIWTPNDWAHRGWTTYRYPEGQTTDPTLLHYDHVHVDVQRGT